MKVCCKNFCDWIHRQNHCKDRALENNLCPYPDALRIALDVRRSPLNHKEDKQTFDHAETLAESIQRFATFWKKN